MASSSPPTGATTFITELHPRSRDRSVSRKTSSGFTVTESWSRPKRGAYPSSSGRAHERDVAKQQQAVEHARAEAAERARVTEIKGEPTIAPKPEPEQQRRRGMRQ